MIVHVLLRSRGDDAKDVVTCVVRIRLDPALVVRTKHTPAGQAIFKVTVGNDLHGIVGRRFDDAQIVDEAFAGRLESDNEILPRGRLTGGGGNVRHHAIRVNLPPALRGLVARRPRFSLRVVRGRITQLQARAAAARIDRPVAAGVVTDFVRGVAGRIAKHDTVATAQLSTVVADDGQARVERTEVRHVVRDNQIAAGGNGLTCGEEIADAARELPPGQVHWVCAAVVQLQPFLRRLLRRLVADAGQQRVAVHDFVDDDLAAEAHHVRRSGGQHAGIRPRTGDLRGAGERTVLYHHGVDRLAGRRLQEEELVARHDSETKILRRHRNIRARAQRGRQEVVSVINRAIVPQ